MCACVCVQDGLVPALVSLGGVPNDEVQQDVAWCLANLAANEEGHWHVPLYQQVGLALPGLSPAPAPGLWLFLLLL